MVQIETWLKIWCPGCNIFNWACTGDPNDCTIEDLEAIECWNCKRKFWLDEETARDMHWSYLEAEDEPMTLDQVLQEIAHVVKGLSNPARN